MNADDATRTALGISRRDAMAVGATAMLASFAVADSQRSTEPMSMDKPQANRPSKPASPFTVVLGIAQDGGVPQAGSFADARWNDPGQRRHVVSLGVVDPSSGKRFIFDATPDFPRQLLELHRISGGPARPAVDGIFLTHAHIGHYPGLMYLGKEAIGASKVPTYAMPRMRAFLETNGPWSQLVTLGNIALQSLVAGEAVELAMGLRVTPILVPHRGEFSETVAYRIELPGGKRVLWLPDIDTWREWDAMGTRLEDVLASVDVAYVDGCFFADGELPGRDMSKIPHPPMMETITRLAALSSAERAKVRFIHLNHTNPALDASSDAARTIREAGMRVAEEGEIVV
jgi:pyrroloquinoline quinone biosynthesis protein B